MAERSTHDGANQQSTPANSQPPPDDFKRATVYSNLLEVDGNRAEIRIEVACWKHDKLACASLVSGKFYMDYEDGTVEEIGRVSADIVDKTIIGTDMKEEWISEMLHVPKGCKDDARVHACPGEQLSDLQRALINIYTQKGAVRSEFRDQKRALSMDNILFIEEFKLEDGYRGARWPCGKRAATSVMRGFFKAMKELGFRGVVLLSPAPLVRTQKEINKQRVARGEPILSYHEVVKLLVESYRRAGFEVWFEGDEDLEYSITLMGQALRETGTGDEIAEYTTQSAVISSPAPSEAPTTPHSNADPGASTTSTSAARPASPRSAMSQSSRERDEDVDVDMNVDSDEEAEEMEEQMSDEDSSTDYTVEDDQMEVDSVYDNDEEETMDDESIGDADTDHVKIEEEDPEGDYPDDEVPTPHRPKLHISDREKWELQHYDQYNTNPAKDNRPSDDGGSYKWRDGARYGRTPYTDLNHLVEASEYQAWIQDRRRRFPVYRPRKGPKYNPEDEYPGEILEEDEEGYLIRWYRDKKTGFKWPDEWKPKDYANEYMVADWVSRGGRPFYEM